jgi:hypothetical protein
MKTSLCDFEGGPLEEWRIEIPGERDVYHWLTSDRKGDWFRESPTLVFTRWRYERVGPNRFELVAQEEV